MPGVIVTTAVRTGPTNAQTAATATMFLAGLTQRGPDGTVHLITSLSDYEDIYGGVATAGYTHQTIETFFEEGGSRAYVSRVIGSDATEATLELDKTGGTAVITLTAAGKGTWSHSGVLTAQVTQPTAGSNFKIIIRLNGVVVFTSATHTTVAAAVNEINNSATAALYVTATDEGETGIPAVAAAANFTGGTDDASVVAADYVTAIGLFTEDLGPGAICAPGQTSSTVREALIAHAADRRRIAILGFDDGTSVGDAVDEAAAYAVEDDAEFAAFFHPWVKIPNGSLTSTIPPDGYVCGKRALVHNTYGSWNPYAGERSQASFVISPVTAYSKTEADTLDAGFINAIKVINGTTRIYGARSASEDTDNFRFIIAREVLNQIVYEAENALEALLFLPIDGRRSTFSRVQATLTGIMERIRVGGGLYEAFDAFGKQLDPGYTVQVNDAINPLSQLSTGVIKAKVGARVSSVGDTIEVEITKSNLTSTLV
jgi:hypothetical protein